MHSPMAEIWQTKFGKDFGGLSQGCNKAGQKGTNAMFVMTHDEIKHALAAKRKITYANPVMTTALNRMTPTAFGSQLEAT